MKLSDMLFANAMMGEGGGGGGGGSSDFSTATVTVVGGSYCYESFLLPHLEEAFGILPARIEASRSVSDGTYLVPLYKGEIDVVVNHVYEGHSVSVTGDAEADGNNIYITGDCTITVS